ncbi:uncharacterized protein LOC119372589 isoform X3 [Rhipicephalus sanguineus]|uniref:uncharacterized protein LOC119372589 isoform X3 n=1 Tax=Rhipicephalus sanguineus TaxID=34632 RepID=UPI0020C498EF|nr:uncharacterized protein LOC119372589 isoform X3 [Rhipicephalus sanguineus]
MRHQSRHFRRLCYRRWFGIRWATYCTPAAGGDLWNPEEYLLADRHVLGAARERHYSILHVIHQLFFLSRLLCLTIVVYFGIRSKICRAAGQWKLVPIASLADAQPHWGSNLAPSAWHFWY